LNFFFEKFSHFETFLFGFFDLCGLSRQGDIEQAWQDLRRLQHQLMGGGSPILDVVRINTFYGKIILVAMLLGPL
jgi:hypothetical protein